jgi:hypothetical protein
MTATKGNGLDAPHDQPALTNTQNSNTLNSATDTRTNKSASDLICGLKKLGHSVHVLKDGGYIISQWGFSNHAKDIKALQAFAVRVGVVS